MAVAPRPNPTPEEYMQVYDVKFHGAGQDFHFPLNEGSGPPVDIINGFTLDSFSNEDMWGPPWTPPDTEGYDLTVGRHSNGNWVGWLEGNFGSMTPIDQWVGVYGDTTATWFRIDRPNDDVIPEGSTVTLSSDDPTSPAPLVFGKHPTLEFAYQNVGSFALQWTTWLEANEGATVTIDLEEELGT
jgi:hypothetical protein